MCEALSSIPIRNHSVKKRNKKECLKKSWPKLTKFEEKQFTHQKL